MDELLPCPFCNSGDFRIDESTMWTGQRNQLLSVTVLHWCPREEGNPPSIIQMRGKDRKEAIRLWNNRICL